LLPFERKLLPIVEDTAGGFRHTLIRTHPGTRSRDAESVIGVLASKKRRRGHVGQLLLSIPSLKA
jgi:hypothetical protein